MGRTSNKAGYGKRDALVARQKALQRHMQGGL
jgi:hypothetical protein